MRIIRKSRWHQMLKEAYEKGLSIGYESGCQAGKAEERNRGTIIPGYDIDRDIREIQKRKAVDK